MPISCALARVVTFDPASLTVDMREVRPRLASLEASQGTMLQHLGHQSRGIAQLQLRFDRIGNRVERVECRLQLAEAP